MVTGKRRDAPRPNAIGQILAGWQPACVLMAANHLDVFTTIGEEAVSAEEIASRCGAHPRSTRMLLNACVALGILEKDGPLYRNSAEAKESLIRGKPTYMGDGIAHQADLWLPWAGLPESVQTNSQVGERYRRFRGPGDTSGAEVHRNFILAMHNGAMRRASRLADELDLTGRRQLFDAGGGPGTYSIFLVKRYAGLRAIVFDLPRTIEIATEIIAEFGVEDLITTRPGDYFKDDFGQGNDVVLLSAILHSMGPERSRGLLQKAFGSLVPGGLVAVQEFLLSDEGTSPLGAVLFSLNMLVNTGEGQSYSGAEIVGLMEAVGFVEPKIISRSLVVARKP